jgi:hypothetical protein
VIFRVKVDGDAEICNTRAKMMASKLNNDSGPSFIEKYFVAAATVIPTAETGPPLTGSPPSGPLPTGPLPTGPLPTGPMEAQDGSFSVNALEGDHGSNHLPGTIITLVMALMTAAFS